MGTTLTNRLDAQELGINANQSVAKAKQSAEFEKALPDSPLVVIEPSKPWRAINLRDLWAHRELLYFLTWKELKVRYKQTALGVTWALLQPLATMVIFSVIFGKVAKLPSDGVPYPLFAYAGLLPWVFFSNAVTTGGNSLVNNAHVITKVYFPRAIIPAASVCSGLIDLAISFVFLALLMLYYQVPLTANIVMLLPVVILTVLLALGVSLWMAALNVKYRDIRFALPFAIQLWMFLSPIIYPASFLPPRWQKLLVLNPLTGIIEGYRSALFGNPFNTTAFAVSAGITLVLLVYSSYAFRRLEKSFADIV